MSLPGWLEPLPDAAQMRATDAWAIGEQGVPSLGLMERAGEGLADLVAERVPRGRIVIVCGKGNNGGDGLVAARLLRQRGREVDVLCTGPLEDLRGDAKASLDRLLGPPPAPFVSPVALEGAAGIVDAVLGTGFAGEPRDPALSAIRAINAAGTTVVAADVPSGVDASTGEAAADTVRADATATFHAAKLGLWVRPGKACAGEVRVIDIGIPPGAPGAPAAGLIGEGVRSALPGRGPSSTKFTEGNVVVCGGSTGLTGAPCLAAEAAQRAGAGYVTAAIPASLNLIFELRLLEVMSRPLPDAAGGFTPDAVEPALRALERADALVLGPGLGRSHGAAEFARGLAAQAPLPLLLDADGLNALDGDLAALSARSAPTVITPHAGELARLVGADAAEIGARRVHHARDAARRSGAVVVLKGDDSLVAAPDGRLGVSAGSTPALATAGTGDVLSGVAGALLAKGLDPFTAACAAVWLHAAAGRAAARAQGRDTVIASDVIAALGAARDAGPAG